MRRVLAFLLLLAPVSAEDAEVRGLEAFAGSPRARRTLLERGFVVTDATCRQIFSFYVAQRRVFVTTDSALHAYFVNVEESLRALQVRQSARLVGWIAGLRKQLAALVERERLDAAWAKAAQSVDAYLRVAEALATGRPPAAGDGPVARELAYIRAARDRAKKSPLRGIAMDYTRFEPAGAAARYPRFHRAVTWLHEVPFRMASEQETRGAMLLASIDQREELRARDFSAAYREFLGATDDPGVEDYWRIFRSCVQHFDVEPARWARAREALARLPDPRHPTVPTAESVRNPALHKGLRLLPRAALFDNEVFRALAPPDLFRPLVSGEELMAALKSEAATSVVRAREAETVPGYERLLAGARAAAGKAELLFDSTICQARRAVFRSLLRPVAGRDLPAYYRHPDWRFKDLNTCLAGWAHHRYIWDTHAKRHIHYRAGVHGPRGIVEPNREFWGALLDLTVATGAFFRRHGVKEHRFDGLAELVAELRIALRRQLERKPLGLEQKELFKEYGPRLARLCGFAGNSWLVDARLPGHAFGVPVSWDLLTKRERWVGQARPRAIYVLAEQGGHRFVMVGGVLTYRDHIGPAEGDARMTDERWRRRAAAGGLPGAAWHRRYGVDFTDEELLAELRRGRLHSRILARPPAATGEVLARKLLAGDTFSIRSGSPGFLGPDARRAAIDLFARTARRERLVEVLLPMLERAPADLTIDFLANWPEANALAGKLGAEHIDALVKWAAGGHGAPHGLIALVSTIPGAKARQVVLDFLDRTQAAAARESRLRLGCPFSTVVHTYVKHGGQPAARLLLERRERYGENAHAVLDTLLKQRWPHPRSRSPGRGRPDYTDEERRFALELHERPKELEAGR